MSIGAVAERFGLPTHVLRHWEAMGLLAPAAAARPRTGRRCSSSRGARKWLPARRCRAG
ncbi:MerR family DNA-binding transcriptional regulator [Streptomyces sp. 6-11-2]|uniref:MerR family DNA-binding transcriptional regulator n=1 Tax=Streptomyces sp. 6-11-2 TaxID=2585753 RepID=UPI00263B402D|nr:MerR family DNA-binding transcriptional regulator [Streptomyces sp. 6-11-2]